MSLPTNLPTYLPGWSCQPRENPQFHNLWSHRVCSTVPINTPVYQIRQPLEEGPPGCGGFVRSCILDFFVFSHFGSSEELIFHFSCVMSQVLFNDLVCPKNQPTYPQPTRFSGSGMTPESPWKVIKFQAILHGSRSHENWSQGHPKSWKMDTGTMRNLISAKVDFCNTSLAKCLVLQSQTPRFRLKNHQKKQPENGYT